MPLDKPIAFTDDGRPVYDNTPTVVAVLVPDRAFERVLCIQRARDPGKNQWALPGGYHMRGENWQEAGAREVAEETGLIVKNLRLWEDPVTDEYGNNLIIAVSEPPLKRFVKNFVLDADEVLARRFLTFPEIKELDWAFPRHFRAAMRYSKTELNRR